MTTCTTLRIVLSFRPILFAVGIIGMAAGSLSASADTTSRTPGKRVHLFLCSGQSNMKNLDLSVSFTPTLKKAFPGDEIIVVKAAYGGRAIARWVPRGKIYKELLEKAKAATKGKAVDTVSFIWMQGERDHQQDETTAAYKTNLEKLYGQLTEDLKRSDIRWVIGRLSDARVGTPNWDKIRETQVEVADAQPLAAWIDTDDLNGPNDGVHCPPEGYREMGVRFANEAVALIGDAKTASTSRKAPAFTIVSKLLHDDAFARAHDVELAGNYAYVPGKGGSIAIVDISDPENPKLKWFNYDPEGIPDSETAMPVDEHLLLGTRDFLTLDISDPSSSQILKKIQDPARIDRINGMTRFGDHVIAACKSGYVSAFDVSDMKKPFLFGVVDARSKYGLGKPHDVDRFGDHIIVVDPVQFAPPSGRLGIIKVADNGRVEPTDRWDLVGRIEGNELIGANRVQVTGDYAFVGGSFSSKGRDAAGGEAVFANMTVVELSDPTKPKVVANLPFRDVLGRGPNGLTISGDVAFYAGGQTVCAVDIRDPEKPAVLASQSFPRFREEEPKTDNYHDLIYRDGYLYVSAQTDNGFLIMEVNDHRIRELAGLTSTARAQEQSQ